MTSEWGKDDLREERHSRWRAAEAEAERPEKTAQMWRTAGHPEWLQKVMRVGAVKQEAAGDKAFVLPVKGSGIREPRSGGSIALAASHR